MTRVIDPPGQGGEPSGIEPSASEARAQMERILVSPVLQGSSRRRDLLRFLVEETLAGRADYLKGFTIATAVFGRDEAFDAGADPVVRLEAGRLRRSLDSYYVDLGKDDPLRITIPKGAYVPHFEWQTREAATGKSQGSAAAAPEAALGARSGTVGSLRPFPLVAAVIAAGLLAAGGGWYWLHEVAGPGGPSIIVLPFQATGASEDTGLIASGVTEELIADLMRFPDFRLYSAPASFRQDAAADPEALGRDLEVDYVVRGNVQSTTGKVRLHSQLADAETGEILWSGTYDRELTAGDLLDAQAGLAADIATALGEPYGVVGEAMAWRLSRDSAPSMRSYLCVLRAYEYRRAFEDARFALARDCLEEAVLRDPGYADAWAMLGWMHLDAARQEMVPAAEHPAEIAAAVDAATHAVELDPHSQRGLEALAAARFTRGEYAEAERLQRQALALNPNDPEALAQLGWRLAARGDWKNGLPFLDLAIARSANPPGWYFHLIAVHDYLKGDYAAALDAAERSATMGSAVGLSLAAMSHAKLGDMEAARSDLAAMARAWPLLARDPAAAYASFQGTEDIVAALVAGLRDAGWTPSEGASP